MVDGLAFIEHLTEAAADHRVEVFFDELGVPAGQDEITVEGQVVADQNMTAEGKTTGEGLVVCVTPADDESPDIPVVATEPEHAKGLGAFAIQRDGLVAEGQLSVMQLSQDNASYLAVRNGEVRFGVRRCGCGSQLLGSNEKRTAVCH